ncbi:polyhydroxyalkanoate granule-associated phasin [Aquisalimonas sp.]|uniref:polyhydroxyalkanoate granule-associated phasin n=1 Tax=Aquisalimonas sp. TaxID=1872621 RepID=UPI0025C61816|nr:polyhydroxyalkanoate granule-associated phasin [Aquisalimonas sp.]
MTRRRTGTSFINPFLAWGDLAMKTSEMMLASGQVIGHRTGRMASAGSNPSPRDRREFTRMGQEKIEAATESAQAMGLQMMRMDPLLGPRMLKQMMAGTTAMMSLATSQTWTQFLVQQAKLSQAVAQAATTGSRMSGAAARVSQRGLKPIHSRATANAKRLGKRN